MNILNQIDQDLNRALKEKRELETSVLRMAKSVLHNAQIEKKAELSNEEIAELVQKEVKKRQEASEFYQRGNRQDLAEKEQKEEEILKKFLPPALSEEEIEKIVKEAILESKAQSPQDIGKVMSLVMPKVKGRAGGNRVSEITRKILESSRR